jgi:mannose-6-phosphate isomerase-like protein (cupin superfamily)
VLSGTAVFTAGEEKVTVAGGNVVVVPAETPHGFESATTTRCGSSACTSPAVKQAWL